MDYSKQHCHVTTTSQWRCHVTKRHNGVWNACHSGSHLSLCKRHLTCRYVLMSSSHFCQRQQIAYLQLKYYRPFWKISKVPEHLQTRRWPSLGLLYIQGWHLYEDWLKCQQTYSFVACAIFKWIYAWKNYLYFDAVLTEFRISTGRGSQTNRRLAIAQAVFFAFEEMGCFWRLLIGNASKCPWFVCIIGDSCRSLYNESLLCEFWSIF